MTDEITIVDLERLLREKGFTTTDRRGLHRRFTHVASGATVSLPAEAPGPSLPTFRSAVRVVLDHAGLMNRDEFDEWMWNIKLSRKHAPKGKAEEGTVGNGAPQRTATARRADGAKRKAVPQRAARARGRN